MPLKKTILSCIFIFQYAIGFSQNISENIGLDSSNPDRREIIALWTNYLKSDPYQSNDFKDWLSSDKSRYASYDLLKNEGYLSPSIYAFGLSNKILSIEDIGNGFLIRSAFYHPETFDIYAVTFTPAVKENNRFVLTNYQPELTKEWTTKTCGYITYHFFPGYDFNQAKAEEANRFLSKICHAFGINPKPMNYFITRDCDDIFRTKGFDFVLGMGTGKECGFYDNINRIIYATAFAGENHQHEITHVVNEMFSTGNSLLLSGLSAYWGGDNAHRGQTFLHHVNRVHAYLEQHPEVDLNRPSEFWQLDELTNPSYVTGGLLCYAILKKGNIGLLKNALSQDMKGDDADQKLMAFFRKHHIVKTDLNTYLRKTLKEISEKNKLEILYPQ